MTDKRDRKTYSPEELKAMRARAAKRFSAEKQADMEAFDRILNRKGGQPPRPGDELPDEN